MPVVDKKELMLSKSDIKITRVTMYNPETFNSILYMGVGIKYTNNGDTDSNSYNMDDYDIADLSDIIKDSLLTEFKNINKTENAGDIAKRVIEVFGDNTYTISSDMIDIKNSFFDYVKKNNVKISIIKMSDADLEKHLAEKKVKTIKLKNTLVTLDKTSADDIFDGIVKELYYIFGDKLINIYTIYILPCAFKIINNVPLPHYPIYIRTQNYEE